MTTTMTTTQSMARQFIDRLDGAINVEAHWSPQSAVPRTTESALAAEVDLACDVLTDAEIRRQDLSLFGGLTKAELINVTMPDGSELSALCSWTEDHIDLAEGRYDQHSWPQMRDVRTVLNPWGPPGDRAFDNIQAGHNATPPAEPPEQDEPDDGALALQELLADA